MADLYSYFERNESLTANILRDMQVVPAMKELHAPMLEAAFDHMRRVLCDGYRDESGQTRRLREATVALALDFRTWQILVRDRGCATSEAIDLISQLISRAGQ